MSHHHHNDGEHGRGIGHRHAPGCMAGADPFSFRSRALDSGDAYEFTFTKAGGLACFRGLPPHKQGTIAVAP